MKKKIILAALLPLVLACSTAPADSTASDSDSTVVASEENTAVESTPEVVALTFTDILPAEAAEAVAAGEWQVLDVRTPEEWAAGVLHGAVRVNIYDEGFQQAVADQVDLERPVLVYCKAGGRSAKAAGMLIEAGYKNVMNLNGGMTAWQAAGLPIEP